MNSILEERTIDLRDLFAEIVQRLGIILLVAVLCAVALPAYKYMKDSKAANVVTELTDEEKQQVETYLSKKAIYENMEEYVTDSEFMKLNPYNTAQEVISYKVTTGTSDMDVNGIIKVFKDWINGGGITGVDNDLISCDNTSAKNTVVTDISANAFTVTLWAAEEDELDGMVSSLESEISSFATGLHDTYDFTLAKVSQAESNVYSSIVENRQQTIMTNMSTAKTELDTLYGTLTDNQKSAAENGENENNTENIVKPSLSVKYIVVGFIIGLIVAAIFVAVIYVIKGKIIVDDDLWTTMGIVDFGRIVCADKLGTFERLAGKIRGIDENTDSLELIAAKICRRVKDEEKIIISGESNEKIEQLKKYIAERNIEVLESIDVFEDANLQEKISKDDKIIVLVSPYVTKTVDFVKKIYNSENVDGIIEIIK